MKKNKKDQQKEDQELLDSIAKKHKVKDVFMIESFNIVGEKAVSFHKKPSRADYGSALSMLEKNPITAKEIIIRSTFLEGDERVFTDDEFFYSACTVIDELLTVRLGTIKKN